MKNALDKLEMSAGIFDIGLSPDDCENILSYIKKLKEENKKLKEENKKLKEQLLNYQMPPHNQKCHWTKPPEITCTTITDGK